MGRRNLIEAMNKHLCLILAVLCVAAALLVRTVGAAETPPGPAPQKVQDLLTLLRDPTVADWLTAEIKAKAAQEAAHPGPTFQLRLEEMLQSGRQRVAAVRNGLTLLGSDFAASRSEIAAELAEHGFSRGWQLIIAFIGLGLGSLWLAVTLTRRAWQELADQPIRNVDDRLKVILGRTQIASIRMLAFTLGSLGLFLLFDWPPKVRTCRSACSPQLKGWSAQRSSPTSC
jgi:moderate conductance mechanosensitive channel